jgi:sec-independent protein translocase protein TatA
MGIHWYELLPLALLALLVFGPKRLPEIGSSIGKTIREFQKSMREVTNGIDTPSVSARPAEPAAPALPPTQPAQPAQPAEQAQPERQSEQPGEPVSAAPGAQPEPEA